MNHVCLIHFSIFHQAIHGYLSYQNSRNISLFVLQTWNDSKLADRSLNLMF